MDGEDAHLIRNRVSMLYDNILPSAIMGCTAGLLLCVAYWSLASHVFLVGWLSALLALFLGRLMLTSYYKARAISDARLAVWARAATAMIALTGLTWGIAGAMLVGAGTAETALLYCCFALGAILSISGYVAWWPAHLVFQMPIFLLTALGFLLTGHPIHRLLAVACVALCVACTIIGRRLSHVFGRIIDISARNAHMAAAMDAQAKALEQANTQLQEISETDFLTGLWNRRRMMALLTEQKASHGIILFDIDHFKAFNDDFGHGAGDRCLQAVAEVASVVVAGHGGALGRHGGEEFLAILPDATAERLWSVAEEIRRVIAQLHESSDWALGRPVTVSLGLALADGVIGPWQRLESADAQLYHAKRAGRNRAAMASATSPDAALPAASEASSI